VKNLLILLVSLTAATRLLAQAAGNAEVNSGTSYAPRVQPTEAPDADIFPRWSIVGDWRMTHPSWRGVLTIRADGTVSNSRATGRWVLTSEAGTPLLVIRWDLSGTDSIAMVTPDHFRGQHRKDQFIDMRRGEEGVAAGK
jgi:hypothetical protein